MYILIWSHCHHKFLNITEDNPLLYIMILQNYHIWRETGYYGELFVSKICFCHFLVFYLDLDFFKLRFCSDRGEVGSVYL